MPELINNEPAGDSITASNVLQIGPANPDTIRALTFDVLLQPAYVQYALPDPGQPGKYQWEQQPRFVVANKIGTVARGVAGARFANAIPGQVAHIVAELHYKSDPDVEPGELSGATISATGQVGNPLGGISGQIDGTANPPNIITGTGFTAVRNSTGDYTITFTAAFANIPIVSCESGSTANLVHRYPLGFPSAGNSFRVAFSSTGGVATDCIFSFLAYVPS